MYFPGHALMQEENYLFLNCRILFQRKRGACQNILCHVIIGNGTSESRLSLGSRQCLIDCYLMCIHRNDPGKFYGNLFCSV